MANETKIVITAQDHTQAAFGSATRGLSSLSGVVKTFAATLAAGLGFREVIAEAMKSEEASARLSGVLRNVGKSAGITKREIDDLADAMAQSTRFDDESIRNAASEILKFGTIHGTTFKEVLKVSADVASFMGTDVVSAAKDVAKAMANPETATKLLKTAGVILTEQEKDQIKTMGELGDKAGQQALVLARLKAAYAGMAEEINSGLTKATTGAKKAWDEFLESLGKTTPVQATAKSALGFVEQSLKDLKSIIEDGDWVEKLLATAAFAGGFRGFKLSKQDDGGDRPGSVSGKIGGLPARAPAMTDAEFLAWKKKQDEAAAAAKKAREEAIKEEKRLQEKGKRGTIAYYQALVDEDFANTAALATVESAAAKEHQDREEKLQKEDLAGWVAYAQARIDIDFEETKQLAEIQIEAANAATKANDIGRELGLTFSSAFEDAVVGGKKFQDVLKGIGQDIARIITRKSITEPMAKGISGLIDQSGVGDWFKGLFSSSSTSAWTPTAKGGVFDSPSVAALSGGIYRSPTLFKFANGGVLGEAGPEAVMPLKRGPDGKLGVAAHGGGGPVFNVDMRGASVEAVARLERLVASVNGSIERRAMNVVSQARTRGVL